MNLGHPLADVSPGVRGELLTILARLEIPVTRRELARQAGVAPGNAGSVLDRLVEAGIVHEQRAGRASLVSLNRQHLAAGPLIALAGARRRLVDRLRERLVQWPDVDEAWLFGSVARTDADSGSDVDILVVSDALETQDMHARIAELQADLQAWTGNDLQLVEHTPQSWRALVDSGNPLSEQITRDGISLLPAPRDPRQAAGR